MRGAMAILSREIHERRVILVAALVAGLIPFVSALFPGVSASRIADARQATAMFLALCFGAVLAIMLGATVVGRDLFENRLGFDFARPIGATAIWAGRLAAAVVLTLAAQLVIVGPTALVSGGLDLPAKFVWAMVGAVLLLIPLAHAVGLVFRSRTRWLAFDLVVGSVVFLLVASAARLIAQAGGQEVAGFSLWTVVALLVPCLWVASALQLVRGRTDTARGHRVLSLAIWLPMLALSFLFWGGSRWYTAAEPDDLVHVRSAKAASGSWIVVGGNARWRPGLGFSFLVDVESGRWIRTSQGWLWGVHFSEDGTRAVWLEISEDQAAAVVMLAELDRTDVRPRATSIVLVGDPLVALSPSGRRLAVKNGSSLAVYGVDDGSTVDVARWPEAAGDGWIVFPDEDRVWLNPFEQGLTIYEYDLAERRHSTIALAGPECTVGRAVWSHDHERALLRCKTGLQLVDGRTGEALAWLRSHPRDVRFLADGRIAVATWGPGIEPRLSLFSNDGVEERVVTLGQGSAVAIGAEVAPDLLSVGLWDKAKPSLVLVDLQTGGVRTVEGAYTPARQSIAKPGSIGARLVSRGGALYLLDPESRTTRHLFGEI